MIGDMSHAMLKDMSHVMIGDMSHVIMMIGDIEFIQLRSLFNCDMSHN